MEQSGGKEIKGPGTLWKCPSVGGVDKIGIVLDWRVSTASW